MPSFLQNKVMRHLLYGMSAIVLVFLTIFAFYNWLLSLAGAVLYIALFIFVLRQENSLKKEMNHYISLLSHRVRKVGEEALLEMPIGIMLINEDYYIEWANPFMASCLKETSLVGRSLYDVCDILVPIIKQDIDTENVSIFDRKYRMHYKKEERLLYFFDITEQAIIEKKYEEERPVIAVIYLDNYDEFTQGMDDQSRGSLNNRVMSILNDWATEYGIYLKRISSDRYIALFNEKILNMLERNKFSILDTIRESKMKPNMHLTLSIGVGAGISSLPELGSLAQSSLDLVLGRGGDQVAIKQPNGKVRFLGGKTNPVEKRTRVRARVISHALSELIQESNRVIIMGHKFPDLDAIGASIGVLKIAKVYNKEAYIVVNKDEVDSSVKKLLEEIKERSELYLNIISPEVALEKSVANTLLIIVDTHKPSLVIEERLINRIDRVVVIDHHRRSEEFIKNPLLVYMEPYASSTSELVTELLEYHPHAKLDYLEATALLSGIIVDTKSFSLRTGSRTFDAASYLRSKGADTVLVQKFMKQDLNTFIKRAKLLENANLYRNGVAIAKGSPDEEYSPVIIAQTADTLLTMENVEASFVISKRPDQSIGISARSLGNLNVQIIMEQLEGGGHLMNAATQLQGVSIDEAEERLKKVLDQFFEGGNES